MYDDKQFSAGRPTKLQGLSVSRLSVTKHELMLALTSAKWSCPKATLPLWLEPSPRFLLGTGVGMRSLSSGLGESPLDKAAADTNVMGLFPVLMIAAKKQIYMK
jgi:hypothetical protein